MKEAIEGKSKEWTRVAIKALSDEEFRSRLLADPVPVLKEMGIVLPEGAKITMPAGEDDESGIKIDGMEHEIFVMFPYDLLERDVDNLTDDDLDEVVGGAPTSIDWTNVKFRLHS